MTTQTTAQQIAAALDNHGMQFHTRPNDDSEPQTFEDLVEQHGGASLDQNWEREATKYTFRDGSIITVMAGAWDFGFADCWCWADEPNDDCASDHAAND